MAVAIRLQRIGKPKQPYYRVVAIDSRRAAQGKPLEILGSYNPRADKAKDRMRVKVDRVEYWIKVGARPSETVASLLKVLSKKSGDAVVDRPKRSKAKKKAAAKEAPDKGGEKKPGEKA